MISTPCVRLCTLDGDVCVGCRRTLAEIMAWGSMSEPQRRAIMDMLPARLAGSDAQKQADREAQADQDEKDPEGHFQLPPRP